MVKVKICLAGLFASGIIGWLCLGLLPIMSGCSFPKKFPINESFLEEYPSDNFVENYLEDLVEDKIGLRLDFSPGSEEREDRWED